MEGVNRKGVSGSVVIGDKGLALMMAVTSARWKAPHVSSESAWFGEALHPGYIRTTLSYVPSFLPYEKSEVD